MKKEMVGNRKNITQMVGDISTFRSDMFDLLTHSKKDMDASTQKFLECTQSNMWLHAGHQTHDLNLSDVRHTFGCQNPVLLANLYDNISICSGAESSADLVKVVPGKGFEVVQTLKTDGNEVYSACLVDGG